MYLCAMNEEEQAYLDHLANEVDREITSAEITGKLLENAKKGNVESIKLLAELGKAGRISKLRKELFGV